MRSRGVWHPELRLLTAGLVLIVTLVASESLAVATVMPLVKAELGQVSLYGWVFSGFFLGNLVGIGAAGRAADRTRLTVPFAAGLVLFALGLTCDGLATSMPMLVAARCIQGLGAGALPTTAYVAIGRGYTEAARPRMFALLSTAWVLPSLFGPGISGLIGEAIGWRWVFLGLLPLVLAGGVVAFVAVAHLEVGDDVARGDDQQDGGLVMWLWLAVGAGVLLAGLSIRSPVVTPLLIAGGSVLGVWSFARLTPGGTLRARRGLPATILERGILTFAFFCTDAYVTLALTTVRGTSAVVAGLALTVATLTWTASAWVQERTVHSLGPRRLARVGFALLGTGTILLAFALDAAVPVVAAVIAFGCAGAGIGLVYAPLSVTVLSSADPGQEGTAAAALQVSDVLGIALGTGVGGALVALSDALAWEPRAGLTLVFVVSTCAAVVGFSLAGRIPALLDATRTTG